MPMAHGEIFKHNTFQPGSLSLKPHHILLVKPLCNPHIFAVYINSPFCWVCRWHPLASVQLLGGFNALFFFSLKPARSSLRIKTRYTVIHQLYPPYWMVKSTWSWLDQWLSQWLNPIGFADDMLPELLCQASSKTFTGASSASAASAGIAGTGAEVAMGVAGNENGSFNLFVNKYVEGYHLMMVKSEWFLEISWSEDIWCWCILNVRLRFAESWVDECRRGNCGW